MAAWCFAKRRHCAQGRMLLDSCGSMERLARLRTLVRDRFEAWERAVASADRCVRAVLRPLRCVDPPWWWWWLR